jgi:hypothetical protein
VSILEKSSQEHAGPTNGAQPPTTMVEMALSIAATGMPVFPCDADKRPLTKSGFKDASTDPATIQRWFQRSETKLIGVPTGTASGIDVMDLDPRHGSDAWRDANIHRLDETRIHQTRSGGEHWLFQHHDGVFNSAGQIAPGIDVRGEGGYVVWPGSPGYTVISDADIAPWPTWLVQAALKKAKPAPRPVSTPFKIDRPDQLVKRYQGYVQKLLDNVRNAPEGAKHTVLLSNARALGGIIDAAGISEADAERWLIDALPATVLDWKGAAKTALDGLRHGAESPFDLEDRPRPNGQDYESSDQPKVKAEARGAEEPAGATAPDLKRPLFRPLPPASAFPMHALGALRDAAEAIQTRTQAPAAMCAQSVLGAATLAVQAHRDVELPGAGRRPLVGLFASIAESGERKTSVDRIALAPGYRVEEQWRQEREGKLNDYQNDLEAWEAARESAKKKNKGDRFAIREALDAVGPEPKAPPQAMLVQEDFSPEALVLHLRDARPWTGVFTSEGGTLVGGHAFNEEKAMQTGALLNTLWDGGTIRRSRVLTGNAFLPGRRCSMHNMMQRVVADKLLGDAVLDGIGLMARMLIVEPKSTVGSRMFRETPAECASVLRDYTDRMVALLMRDPVMAPDTQDVLDPPAMSLTADARAMWVSFHDAVETDLRHGGDLHPIPAFGAKMAEHAGRLAAVLSVYADPDTMEVNDDAMECGIALVQHYAVEMLRLHGGAAVSPDLRLASRLLAWWQGRPDPQCHLAAIYQRGLNAIGDAATARRIVTVLYEHGWLRRLPPGTAIDGAPRREAWELVR